MRMRNREMPKLKLIDATIFSYLTQELNSEYQYNKTNDYIWRRSRGNEYEFSDIFKLTSIANIFIIAKQIRKATVTKDGQTTYRISTGTISAVCGETTTETENPKVGVRDQTP